MKDSKTILLLIVSLCLVATWGYHIYDKNKYSGSTKLPGEKDSAIAQQAINDSLQRNYTNALIKLGTVQVDNDSISIELRNKIREIDSLRNEISLILGLSNITRGDLNAAEEKINLLQEKVVQLKTGQKTTANKSAEVIPVNEKKMAAATPQKNIAVKDDAGVLMASNASIRAMQQGSRELTTNKADATESFVVSCVLQSNTASFSGTEVFIIVTAPGGAVIQDDQWQGGMFSTANGSRIPYTRKSMFSYNKGETKRISVTIKPAEIETGVYTVQFYHNGQRIGRADVKLN